MVPVVGLEPTRCCHQRILNPSRLPIPSHRLIVVIIAHIFINFNRQFAFPAKTGLLDKKDDFGYNTKQEVYGRKDEWNMKNLIRAAAFAPRVTVGGVESNRAQLAAQLREAAE